MNCSSAADSIELANVPIVDGYFLIQVKTEEENGAACKRAEVMSKLLSTTTEIKKIQNPDGDSNFFLNEVRSAMHCISRCKN